MTYEDALMRVRLMANDTKSLTWDLSLRDLKALATVVTFADEMQWLLRRIHAVAESEGSHHIASMIPEEVTRG